MNALIRLLQARGHNIILENGRTFVVIEDEKIQYLENMWKIKSLKTALKQNQSTDVLIINFL